MFQLYPYTTTVQVLETVEAILPIINVIRMFSGVDHYFR